MQREKPYNLDVKHMDAWDDISGTIENCLMGLYPIRLDPAEDGNVCLTVYCFDDADYERCKKSSLLTDDKLPVR
jgi:hypothetical protein